MKEAESIIDELLAWEAEVEKPNLNQIEEVVLELRERLSQKMAQSMIEAQKEVRPVPGPRCEQCGQEMRYKGQKKVNPQTWVGDVAFERGHYYCAECKAGFFPLGRTTGVEGQTLQ